MTPAELTALRNRLDLSQAQLGEVLGKDERTIRRYETGEYPIPKTVELALTAYANMRKER